MSETDPTSGVDILTFENIKRVAGEVRRELDTPSEPSPPGTSEPPKSDPLDWESKALADAQGAAEALRAERELVALAEAALMRRGVSESTIDSMSSVEKLRATDLGGFSDEEKTQKALDAENAHYLANPDALWAAVRAKEVENFVRDYHQQDRHTRKQRAEAYGLSSEQVFKLEEQASATWDRLNARRSS